MREKIRAASTANLALLIAIVVFIAMNLVVATFLTNPSVENNFVLYGVLAFLPAIVAFGSASLAYKIRFKTVLAPDGPILGMETAMKVAVAAICIYFAILPLNLLGVGISKLIGLKEIESNVPTASNVYEYIASIVIFCGLPAFFEETFFRGILHRANEVFLGKKIIPFTAIAFSLMHLQIQGVISLFVVGMVLSFIYYYTKSIKLCMIYHFVHNLVAVTLGFVLQNSAVIEEQAELSSVSSGFSESTIAIVIAGCISVAIIVGFAFAGKALLQSVKKDHENMIEERELSGSEGREEQNAMEESNESETDVKPIKVNYIPYVFAIALQIGLTIIITISLIMMQNA